jgi:glycosyltransferase involved in cell wall biosynthesis
VNAVALCPFRKDVRQAGGDESASCDLLAAAVGSHDSRVGRDVCDACCESGGSAQVIFNPVLSSVVYDRADRRLAERPPPADAERFVRMKREARCGLPHDLGLLAHGPGALGVIGPGERRVAATAAAGRSLTWAIAVLASGRRLPPLSGTLASLREAGFDRVHIFAEPEAAAPPPSPLVTVTRHVPHQGQVHSFVFAARTLLQEHPAADCYALFDGNISVARGLRRWCDERFWPGGQGVVSLFTSCAVSDDRPGWQTLNLGRYRTFGATAFVVRGDELRELVADGKVSRHVEGEQIAVNAVVGEWALRRGIGIAYHSPSLVQYGNGNHMSGRADRAVAVESVTHAATWRPPPFRIGRVGLVGWNTPTGLGYQNRDIAEHLPVSRWLAVRHPCIGRLSRPSFRGEYLAPWLRTVSPRAQRAWLAKLDWLLFVEQPCVPGILQRAHDMGVTVACVPNWEFLTPGTHWLPYVDQMICPTETAYHMLSRWRRELGFAWDVVHVPWPIDHRRFPFRRRERCRRFLFVNGTGGAKPWRLDGSRTPYRRKGMHLIAATARLLPRVPFLVYSQIGDLPPMSDNVEVRPAPKSNSDLYHDGDVCVLPSHWEGLGLQLLECQAAGLPLVTTDAPPMNECRPFRTVRAAAIEPVFINGDQPVPSHLIRPEDLAAVLDEIYDSDIRDASEQARAYVERERSWDRMRAPLAARLPA